MTLDQIFEEWEKDGDIDRSELGHESLNIPKLHHKYYKMYASERLRLRKMEAELKQLKHEKTEFYQDGPTEEQLEKGWKLPPKGRILKSDVPGYVDTDDDVVKETLRVSYQREKVEALESIIKNIANRGFQISAAIQWEKFKVGA